MKAIILSAGEGRRLRSLTEKMPKCLIPVNGKPLLEYWLDHCQKASMDDVIINGFYLADQVRDYLRSVENRYAFKIRFVAEDKLYGTGGTVKNQYELVKEEPFFFFCHGDNFTDINLNDFIRFHQEKQSTLTVAVYETTVPKQCGIMEEIDESGRVLKFTEKPQNPKTNLASAALFLMSQQIIKEFPKQETIDFSKEILPKYQGEMFAYRLPGFNVDIGTMENYKLANSLALQMA